MLQSNGGYPPDTALDDPIHPAPPAGTAATTWRDLLPGGFTKLSYTQWEVILARFWKKTLFFYFRSPKLRTKAPQTADDDLPHQELFDSDLKACGAPLFLRRVPLRGRQENRLSGVFANQYQNVRARILCGTPCGSKPLARCRRRLEPGGNRPAPLGGASALREAAAL